MVLLGRISSSFYFVQFAVLGWIGPLVPPRKATAGTGVALVAITLIIAGSVAADELRWIEQPINAATW